MNEWVAVQPLTDDDLNHRYWSEPKIGDRVRIRLSGECSRVFPWRSDADGSNGYVDVPRPHDFSEDGRSGEVIGELGVPPFERHSPDPHGWVVKFDVPVAGLAGSCYAACELERMP